LSSLIYIGIGIVGGIVFAVSYPDTATLINDSLMPTVSVIIDKVKEITIDIFKEEILK
jgi:hypothetical protein